MVGIERLVSGERDARSVRTAGSVGVAAKPTRWLTWAEALILLPRLVAAYEVKRRQNNERGTVMVRR